MTTKERLHRLVDELPDDVAATVETFAEFVMARRSRVQEDDPVLRAFMDAPLDDEPLTDDDIAAIEEGKAAAARGDGMTWQEYLAGRQGSCEATST